MNDEPELPFDRPKYPDYPGYVNRSTSVAAAHAIAPKMNRLQVLVLEALQTKPRTNEELETDLHMGGNTVRPRVRELFLKGRVQDSGYRRLTRSGREAIVWQAMP